MVFEPGKPIAEIMYSRSLTKLVAGVTFTSSAKGKDNNSNDSSHFFIKKTLPQNFRERERVIYHLEAKNF